MEDMKNRLLCTTLELQSVKMEAGEEMKKYKDYIKHLLGLLKIAYQERDEARDQLHRLFSKLTPPNPSINELSSGPAYSHGPQPDNYPVAAKAISSLTESNNSHSPVDSFLDAVSSPDSSSLVFVNQRLNNHIQADPCSGVIDDLAKGKALPQKGKLLQAVMEAGPLLQTLLVAGPLPQWRNPPPLKPIRVPDVISMKGHDPASTSRHQPVQGHNGIIAPKLLMTSGSYCDLPRANPQMCSASMVSFMGSTGFPYSSSHQLSSGSTGQFPMAKRQRFQ